MNIQAEIREIEQAIDMAESALDDCKEEASKAERHIEELEERMAELKQEKIEELEGPRFANLEEELKYERFIEMTKNMTLTELEHRLGMDISRPPSL